eukprot:gnl/MRDRNA2_/MRDRNA2_101568_c0_seq1.p1 gnl/MRDRNA2_/MRDRNA2_101568_c0~~gnl/MRDRNA2_/MRDRNA2_101568_c0_seq1.p1  ORF type:complete len:378 (-),score=97.47 gnl/MRDRNA2_/MRDRNA2_101568_c0_seq1:102-1235(-)
MASAGYVQYDPEGASSAAAALAKASQVFLEDDGNSSFVSNGLDHLRGLLEQTEKQAARAVKCTEMRSSTEVPLRDELAQARCEAAMWRLRAQAAQGECSVARVSEASLQRKFEHLEYSASFRGVGQASSGSHTNFSSINLETLQSKQDHQVAQEVAQLRQQLCAKDMELDAAKAAHVLSRTEAEARAVWIKQQAQLELSAHAALIEAERLVYERRINELESNAERAHNEIQRQAKDAAAAFNEMQAGFALMLEEAQALSEEHRSILQKLVNLSRTKVIAYCGQPIEANTLCSSVVLSPQPAPAICGQPCANLAPIAVESAPGPCSQMRRAVSPMPIRQLVQAPAVPAQVANFSSVPVGTVASTRTVPCQIVNTARRT